MIVRTIFPYAKIKNVAMMYHGCGISGFSDDLSLIYSACSKEL
jgi:hypothetical protein